MATHYRRALTPAGTRCTFHAQRDRQRELQSRGTKYTRPSRQTAHPRKRNRLMGAQGKVLGLRAPPAQPSLLCGFNSRRGPHLRPPWLLNPELSACQPAGAVLVSSPPVSRPREVLRKPLAQAARPACEFLAQQLLLGEAGSQRRGQAGAFLNVHWKRRRGF
ncbi:hypothetical protein D623_10014725 [Myotis brandtii]|uniref:Uncharacterized protein n=1 Tax=Myotis brandtii TaxID=109478 RepID=S7MEC0_MYOBR|nr:hypothetical protein D623_10014725 [Myotis brandtii]